MSNSNQIIHPAPDQTVVSPNTRPSVAEVVNVAKVEAEQREEAIKNLSKKLRTINNTCHPLNDYIKFQQCISPDIRVLLDLNQMMMFLCAIKASVKSNIDCEYMDITNPPESLKASMEKAYASVDFVADSFVVSLKQIVALMQSRLTKHECNSSTGVLSSMISESKLP